MMSCEICGKNITLKVGFDGLAASLRQIVEQVSLYVNIIMALQPPRRGFLQAMFEKLLELVEDPGGVQYQASISKNF